MVEAEGVETTLLNITSLEAVKQLVKAHDIHCIINCAAYTNVDKAESDEAFCRVLNAEAPRNLAEAMKEVNGLLIHISTDYVLEETRITFLAGRTRKGLLPVLTDAPNWKEKSTFRPQDAIMLFFVRLGYIPNMARTSSRPC